MPVIYQPRGAAAEYAELATNPYQRCPFGCRYCYVPDSLQRDRRDYQADAGVRSGYLIKLATEAPRLADSWYNRHGSLARVHFSFVGDPYQPVERRFQQTRQAIIILKRNAWPVQVLTKSNDCEDLGLLDARDRFGVTLTAMNGATIARWEPDAPSPAGRVELLRQAKERGIGTWVSIEPVLTLQDGLAVLAAIADIKPDLVWLGKLNHQPGWRPDVSWRQVRDGLVDACQQYGLNYALKDSFLTV